MGIREPSWPAASLLGRVSLGARSALLDAGIKVPFQAREVLLQEGQPGNYALLILDGCVKIVSHLESGELPLLAIRVRGDLIGEMAPLDGRPRSATVIAATNGTARRIGKVGLASLIRGHPEIGREIAFVANERLRWANRRRVDFVSHEPLIRVARILAELAETHGEPGPEGIRLDVSLTQPDLASLAGAKLRITQKVLKSLKSDGLIRTGHRWVIVIDVARLRTVAQITREDS